MKKLLFLVLVLVAGIGTGGGAGYAAALLLGPGTRAAAAPAPPPEPLPHYVPAGKILAPLVGADGALSGYVQIEVQLQVAEDKAELVTAQLPLFLHAINMRTYRTPMASGPGGALPDLGTFRKVAEAAAVEAFGAGIVRRVTITGATPA